MDDMFCCCNSLDKIAVGDKFVISQGWSEYMVPSRYGPYRAVDGSMWAINGFNVAFDGSNIAHKGYFRTFDGLFWTIVRLDAARYGLFWTIKGSNVAFHGLFRTISGRF